MLGRVELCLPLLDGRRFGKGRRKEGKGKKEKREEGKKEKKEEGEKREDSLNMDPCSSIATPPGDSDATEIFFGPP